MATMNSLHTPPEYFRNEKDDDKGEKSSIQVAEPVTAEVYDDLREIDLDDNGRERPIGECYMLRADRGDTNCLQ
jgi:hypothetical protein